MDLSITFIFIVIFIIIPGLLFRRLYFFGEFSKQFMSGYNLIELLAISSIPGLILSIVTFYIYNNVFEKVDLSEIIDLLKDINAPDKKVQQTDDSLNELLFNRVLPYFSFLIFNSFLIGLVLGRIIRLTHLDTKIKFLQFSNVWFYFFNGQHSGFKKFRHLKEKGKKHLFTVADILIDTNESPKLYSGIVVDYHVDKKDNSKLVNVVLQNTERYKDDNGKKTRVRIPGSFMVVDCTNMKNINLTYVYEQPTPLLKKNIPKYVDQVNSYLVVFLIPLFIFKSDLVHYKFYLDYFEYSFIAKIFSYLFVIQVIAIFNPYIKQKNEYKCITKKQLFYKVIFAGILYFILWLTT